VDRAQKQKLIDSLSNTFKSVDLVVVTKQTGLTVAEVTDLRRRMRAAGAGFKVAKNRLTRRALEGTRFQGLSDLFKGPTAIAYSRDPVAAAKIVVEFANKNEKLTILGGGLGERALGVDGVKALATLPSLDEIRARLIGTIMAPAQKVAGVIAAPPGKLARVFAAYGRSEGATQA
jgi:large subunit ribosomal protein L10